MARNQLNDDQRVAHEGRDSTIKNDVEQLSKREQVQRALMNKLNDPELAIPTRISSLWTTGNANREEWLARQREFLREFDEFIDPIYSSPMEWSSTLHLPESLTICKTFHARMQAALLSQDPPFTVASRTAANSDRARLVQELMRYTVKDWANEYKGVEEEVDKWLWSWVTAGTGILKVRWNRAYTRFVDVETVMTEGPSRYEYDEQTGETVALPSMVAEEVEREIVLKTFDGPIVEYIHPEDLLIIGGDGDPDRADAVIQQQYLTASDLWTFADQKIFDEDAVRKAIQHGEDARLADGVNTIKQERKESAGLNGPDVSNDLDRYQILECYVRMDIDGSGINSDLIIWVHEPSGSILRATYLYRVSPNGTRPYAKIDFHKREGQDYGAGLVELLYSLTKEIDAIHNMRVDFGLISTLPFGYYRPSSSMETETIPLNPGTLMPVENPQTDVFFPNLGNRTSFGFNEEQALRSQIERLTSISDLSLGLLSGQGAARTATGARAVLGESNANLDVFLRRMNRGWKKVLVYLFGMMQKNLPPGLQFRITGEDGNSYWQQIEGREELVGMFDFELEPSSANSNKQIQLETANQIYQLTSNPLDIQLGIITPLERYESIRNLLQAMGVKDVGRYIKKPTQFPRIFTPEEIANRVLSGIDVPLGPEQDLQGFIQYFDAIMKEDELLGQFSQDDIMRLAQKAAQAQDMMAALQEMQAQQANSRQMQNNAAMSQQQAPTGLNPMAGAGFGAGGSQGGAQ